jgi:hypothetical protein
LPDQIIAPIRQLYTLNAELYPLIEEFESSIYVIGGQAIAYWLNYYENQIIISDEQAKLAQSSDIDYVSIKKDVRLLGEAWGVDVNYAKEDHQPPSTAIISLVQNNKIKSNNEGELFVDFDHFDETGELKPNIVDIIDFPMGFNHTSFKFEGKIRLISEPCHLPDAFGVPAHDKLRVLNPIACIQSRLHNLAYIPHRRGRERARIELLMPASFYFLQDKISDGNFRKAKKYIDNLIYIAKSKEAESAYKLHGVNLLPLCEKLSTLPDTPDKFNEIELVDALDKIKTKYHQSHN